MIPYKEVTSEKSIRLQFRRSSFSPNSAMPYMSALIGLAKLQKGEDSIIMCEASSKH